MSQHLTIEQARELAEQFANANYSVEGDRIVVLDEFTQTKTYGWIFSLQSKRYVDTNNFSYMLVGLGPTIVMNDGSIHQFGTAVQPEEAIRAFEMSRGLQRGNVV